MTNIRHVHSDACWEPDSGCDMGRNADHVATGVPAELPPSKLVSWGILGETRIHPWHERCLLERVPACQRVYKAEEADAEIDRLRSDLQELTCGDERYTRLGRENERLCTALDEADDLLCCAKAADNLESASAEDWDAQVGAWRARNVDGPGEVKPVSMADALKDHVEKCPEHPMSALKNDNERLRAELERYKGIPEHWVGLDGPDGEPFDPAYMRRPVETTAGQTPIARVTVPDGVAGGAHLQVELYDPGLPPGEYDLYCEPEAVAPMMRRAVEKAAEAAERRDGRQGAQSERLDTSVWRLFDAGMNELFEATQSSTYDRNAGRNAYLELKRMASALIAVKTESDTGALCKDCPPVGYPTDKTRCLPCPRRAVERPSETFACPRKICGWSGVRVGYDQGVPVCPKCGGSFEQRTEAPELAHALDYGDALADWINRARPVITELMEAYARRIRSDCIDQADLECAPWRCAEYIAAEELLRDQPKAVVVIERRAVEKPPETTACQHEWSALRRPCHECLKGCGATMGRDGSIYDNRPAVEKTGG